MGPTRSLTSVILDLVTVVAFTVLVVSALGLVAPASPGPRPLPEEYPYVGDGWTAIAVDSDGDPVSWDPCATIAWAYDPTGGPDDGLALVTAAFERMGELTGLSFVYAGLHDIEPSLDGPRTGADGEPLPVRVSWRDSSHALVDDDHVGVAWPLYDTPTAGEPLRFGSGVVILNPEYLDDRAWSFTHRADFGTVVMHEIGHVLGLGHSTEPTGLMSRHPAPDSPPVADHDLAGLRALYPGCSAG